MKKIKINLIGKTLIIISFIGLFLWVGSNDDLCYYTTEVFLQLRLCDGYVEELPKKPGYLFVGAFFFMIVIGLYLVFITRKK